MNFFARQLALANYSLASYLTGPQKKDRVKPSASYFYVIELVYFLVAVAMVALGVIARFGHRFSDLVLVGIFIVIAVFITQAHSEYPQNMSKAGVFRDYGQLTDNQKAKYAWFGALMFVGSFVLIFGAGVLFFENYFDLSQMPGRF